MAYCFDFQFDYKTNKPLKSFNPEEYMFIF